MTNAGKDVGKDNFCTLLVEKEIIAANIEIRLEVPQNPKLKVSALSSYSPPGCKPEGIKVNTPHSFLHTCAYYKTIHNQVI